jgi:glycosyltransferase involved in cell wall biosynthesis
MMSVVTAKPINLASQAHHVKTILDRTTLKLSVIIPVYNERLTIRQVLNHVRATPFDKEIVVVDDCSTDGTRELLASLQIPELRVITHSVNRGKGAAIRTAIEQVTGDAVVIQDADLEYDPADYERLLEPIVSGDADVVYGSRFTGSPRRVLLYWHALANGALTTLSNALTNLNLTDMETGYKAFRADVLKTIPISSDRFGFEPEITAKIAKRGLRIFEVPISYHGREDWEGKKIGLRDAFEAVAVILKYLLVDEYDGKDRGYLTLKRMRRLRNYNLWMYDQIRKGVGRRVLEVGSGIGNMSRLLLHADVLVLTDISDEYLTRLARQFGKFDTVQLACLDLNQVNADDYRALELDTVVCLNVLEHVEHDDRALRGIFDLLAPGGRLLLLVPAIPSLYGKIDRALDHFRRYEREGLRQLLQTTGFEIEDLRYFNILGVPGWFFNARVLQRDAIPSLQTAFYDPVVPLTRLEDHFRLPIGMSLIAIARKPVDHV